MKQFWRFSLKDGVDDDTYEFFKTNLEHRLDWTVKDFCILSGECVRFLFRENEAISTNLSFLVMTQRDDVAKLEGFDPVRAVGRTGGGGRAWNHNNNNRQPQPRTFTQFSLLLLTTRAHQLLTSYKPTKQETKGTKDVPCKKGSSDDAKKFIDVWLEGNECTNFFNKVIKRDDIDFMPTKTQISPEAYEGEDANWDQFPRKYVESEIRHTWGIELHPHKNYVSKRVTEVCYQLMVMVFEEPE